MGFNEQTENGKRWNYAPKKKWKDCYMLFGGIKEEPSDSHNESLTSENYATQAVAEDRPNVSKLSQLDAPYLSTALTSSINHKNVPSHSCNGDWSVICKSEQEDAKNKVQALASASGPLAGLRDALQAHSDQISRVKFRSDDHAIGVYAFKSAVEQEDSITSCSPLVPKGRLAANFIPTNGVIHTVNQVAKELSTIKDELGRKRISMTHASSRDASLRSTPSREVHNKLEKNRRAHLKECFELLRRQLPSMEDKKISNQTILKAAFRYIQTLKRKERELEHEMERLARAKIALQQNVSSLKKELQSKYDHMDFSAIIPDSTTLELMKDSDTKSTTTASEQPDYDDKYDGSDVRVSVSGSPYQSGAEYVDRSELCRSHSDYDQPLNLSTATTCKTNVKMSDWEESPQTLPPSNGSSISKMPCFYDDTSCRLIKDTMMPTPLPASIANSHISHISLPSVIGTMPQVSNQLGTVAGPPANSQITHLSHIGKSGNSISNSFSSITKVVTAWPPSHAVLTESPSVINHSYSSNIPQLTVSGSVGKIISGTTITRVISTDPGHLSTTTVASPETHTLPLAGGSGIHIPAQLLTNGVHLGTHPGGLISQQAIQVITPEGYKLVSTDGNLNGSKPVTILAQSADVLEGCLSEDGKSGPFVVSMNKNGLSAFHLTVPATVTRNSSQGTTMPTVPLNLTVGGATALKVSQAGSASLLPSYIPLANSNGITRLLPGMSVVAPLMVSPSQRGVMIPTVSAAINKTKPEGSNTLSSSSVASVPAQYSSTLAANLVNSVVVVNASNSVGTSLISQGTSNNHA